MPKKPRGQTYLGIDPGKQGGFAVVCGNKILSYEFMPSNDMELLNTVGILNDEFQFSCCYLEQVNSMPGEGHKGAFTFGEGFGKLKMSLVCWSIPYELVHSRTWQKGLGIKSKTRQETKPQFKERLLSKAQQLFPEVALWREPKTLGKQRAVCDAMLIAEYGRRKQEGLL